MFDNGLYCSKSAGACQLLNVMLEFFTNCEQVRKYEIVQICSFA